MTSITPHPCPSHTPPSHALVVQVRAATNAALRAAMQVETEPSAVSAYLRFLATHTRGDSVQDQSGLVSDLAQVGGGNRVC
jgi:integrator complex subunit 1